MMIESTEAGFRKWTVVLLWLGATTIGIFLALLVKEAAYYQGDYIPTGNDSFYHARRMLDLAVGERGFYQFDERIHAPDGIWVPWPWAYDWLMGKAAALAVWLRPATDPLGFLLYVPVAWLAVNAALFLAAARRAGLALPYCALAMLAFALAPFVQLMHMVGKVDHHFVEFTFVLLVTWLGLRWFPDSANKRVAIGLGIALGLAPGFHNGLFVLQLPVLASVGILWLRGHEFSRPGLHALALSLLLSALVVVVPSGPFQQGMFEFGLLSVFHLYVAACTGIVLVFVGWKRFAARSFAMLAGLCVLLVLPIAGQVLQGAAFVSHDLSFLQDVIEATGPFGLIGRFGLSWTVAHYSWLLLLVPLLLAYYLWSAWVGREPRDLFFAVMTVFGLAFLSLQFRFNYFGLFALLVGALLAIQRLAEKYRWHSGLVGVAVLGGLLVAYQPPLRDKLFDVYALGAAPIYERARPIFLELGDRCAEDPGIILADKHDGNYLLFHTDCSVISNNFMLTAEDVRRVEQFGEMLRLTPEALRTQHPEIRYVLLRAWDFYVMQDGQVAVRGDYPLVSALLADGEPPDGFELIDSVAVERDGAPLLYARAFAVASGSR